MTGTVSTIYNRVENMIPFYPNVEYHKPKRDIAESELEADAMYLKICLSVSYEKALAWVKGVADKFDRNDCEKAMEKVLAKSEKVRNRLVAICKRYSLAA